MSDLLNAVAEVARLTGDVALRYYRSNLTVETKTDGSPVTIADRSAEEAARAWITEHFPDHGIVGEEFGATQADRSRRWILDPIDGTKAFVRGVPLWGTLVAVADGEDVLAGAAYFPVVNELIVAATNEGCWWNGVRCQVSDVASLAQSTVLTTDIGYHETPAYRSGLQRVVDRAAVSRTWGDCFGYLLVATGRAEVMLDPVMNPWDAAAVLPIIEEAGGVFTDWAGARTAFGGSVIATNQALAWDVRRAVWGER